MSHDSADYAAFRVYFIRSVAESLEAGDEIMVSEFVISMTYRIFVGLGLWKDGCPVSEGETSSREPAA